MPRSLLALVLMLIAAPGVLRWTDARASQLPAGSGTLRVQTTDRASGGVRVEVYRYEWFDIPPTPGTNALPLAIALAPDGVVWVNQEFHLELQRLDPSTGRVTGIPIPRPAGPGPFATALFGDNRTQMSEMGEDRFPPAATLPRRSSRSTRRRAISGSANSGGAGSAACGGWSEDPRLLSERRPVGSRLRGRDQLTGPIDREC